MNRAVGADGLCMALPGPLAQAGMSRAVGPLAHFRQDEQHLNFGWPRWHHSDSILGSRLTSEHKRNLYGGI